MKPLRRSLENAEITVRKDAGKKSISFPASSETPVERWFGNEVLAAREPVAMRLGRAKGGAMPLLFNHNIDDPIGIVEPARASRAASCMVDANLFETGTRRRDRCDDGRRPAQRVDRRTAADVIEENKKSARPSRSPTGSPTRFRSSPVPADPTVGIGRGSQRRGRGADGPRRFNPTGEHRRHQGANNG
ncbi:MAG: hypothetical protein MZW92_31810 [Comamonadaceae bacterium]|nr:hypothetical protein [Comamonadaceae bacterium]